MNNSLRHSSLSATPAGIILWSASAVLLYYFGLSVPAGLCLFFDFLFLCSWIWTRWSLSRLDIQSLSGTICTFPGNTVSVSFRAANRKLLPLIWLELLFPLTADSPVVPARRENRTCGEDPETGAEVPGACTRLTWLMWNQEASAEVPMRAVKRGICRLSCVTAFSGDLLGLGSRKRTFSLSPAVLAVYPAIFPICPDRLTRSSTDLEAGRNGYMEDVTLLKMNRKYQPGDPAKKINWRQLARQGAITVNIHETVFPRLSAFLLDLASFRRGTLTANSLNGREMTLWSPLSEELEEMLSLTASCILSLHDQGICCGLIIPGEQEEDCLIRYPGRPGSSAEELLYSLAEVNYSGQDRSVPQWEIASRMSSFGTLYLVTESYKGLTFSPELFAASGSAVILARNSSEGDEACPVRLLYMKDLDGRN